jgi:branched-chain amino acid transport system substrate-binding protein
MPHRGTVGVATIAALLVAATACSSSGSGSTSSSGSSSNAAQGKPTQTVTIGVLTDVTGPAAAGNKSLVDGVRAGTYYAARNGYKIKYVVADTATNPSQVMTAAQRLVAQQHVTAVIAGSAITFLAAPYLKAHGVPVIGPAQDGPEWTTDDNMFGTVGNFHAEKVSTTFGDFFKLQGATSVGAIGNGISPISAEAAKGAVASAKAAGLTVGYINANVPLGTTDMQPIAAAMKSKGVNGVTAAVAANTAFALISALKQQGAAIKASALATGYGADLLEAGPGALKDAQNVFFSLGYEPMEMQTAATKAFAADLKSAGISGDPSYGMYSGYTAVGILVRGLKDAGGQPSQSSLTSALQKVHDWNALGLFGAHSVDLNDRQNQANGADNCLWFTQLQGNSFTLVKGADPICGTVVQGVTVSPNS